MEDGENNLVKRVDRLALYKKYSHTAHRTLTNFTNEISEILRQSIERMDTICMKVRGCVCDMEVPVEPHRATSVNFPLDAAHEPTKSARLTLSPIKSGNLGTSSAPEPRSQDKKAAKRKPKLKRKTKKRAASIISFGTIRKRSNFQTPVNDKEEQSVMAKIKEQYQDELDPVQKQLRKKYVTRTRPHKLKKPSRSVDVFLPRTQRTAQSQRINECYTKENFDDNLWFGPKLIAKEPPARTRRVTKLARKYANENFHENAFKERPVISDDIYNGKKLKLHSDNNKDWSVMMHTHRPITRYELKQNSTLGVNRILDEITLKDLEPLKAEYPRKDHLQLPDIPIEQSLLYKLVNGDVKSLEYLIDVDAVHGEPELHRKPRRRFNRYFELQQTIPEEEPQNNAGDMKQPKKYKKRSSSKKPQNEIVIENLKADKRAVNLKEYQLYKKLTRKNDRRLNKFIVSPGEMHEKSYIVMPVRVEYDKDTEARRILASYIYGNDCQTVNVETNLTVMMMQAQTTKEKAPPRNYKFQSNKVAMGNTEQSSILIQKVVDCKQVNKQVPKHQQLISYIVNKQQQQKQKGSTSSAQRIHGKTETAGGKERQKKNPAEIRTLIKGIEQQVQGVTEDTTRNRKLLIGKLQKDIKTILSDMQLDNESIDCSVTSTESLKQSKPCIAPQRRSNSSKSETGGTPPVKKPSEVVRKRGEKAERKPIALAMPSEKYKKFLGYTSAKQQWVEHVAEFTKNISLNEIVVKDKPPDIQVIHPEKASNERSLEDVERFKERFDTIMKEVDKIKKGNPNLSPVSKQGTLIHKTTLALNHNPTSSLNHNPTLSQGTSLNQSTTLSQGTPLNQSSTLSEGTSLNHNPTLSRSTSLNHNKTLSQGASLNHNPTLSLNQSPSCNCNPIAQGKDPVALKHNPTLSQGASLINHNPTLTLNQSPSCNRVPATQKPGPVLQQAEKPPKRYKIKPESIGLDKLSKEEQEKKTEVTKRILGKWLALENPSITEIGKPRRKVERKILREVKMQTLHTADKATDALVSAPMEEKIEAFEHELGEETNKFCQELNGVMEKIQDKSWSPFQSEIKQSNFSNILDGLVTIRDSIKHCFVYHQASVKHIASEQYIKINLEQMEKREPPENIYEELLEETTEREPSKEIDIDLYILPGDDALKLVRQKIDEDAIEGVRQELKENTSRSETSPVVEVALNLKIERRDYKKLLTVFYGVMFAVVFCGLNFKYSCA